MTVSLKIEDTVAYLTINRPAQRNAISMEMWQQITSFVEALDKEAIRLLIIRGEGGVFSAGADLSEITELEDADSLKAYLSKIERALGALMAVEFPSIAVIDKYCFGGGCLLALSCDLRYASEDAVFQIPVARNGFALDDGIVLRLTALIGPSNAKELIFLGKTIKAPEAKRIGLVNDVFDANQIAGEIMRIAQAILKCKPDSLARLKRQIDLVVENIQP